MMRSECYFHDFLYLETEIRFFFLVYLNTKNIEKFRETESRTLAMWRQRVWSDWSSCERFLVSWSWCMWSLQNQVPRPPFPSNVNTSSSSRCTVGDQQRYCSNAELRECCQSNNKLTSHLFHKSDLVLNCGEFIRTNIISKIQFTASPESKLS